MDPLVQSKIEAFSREGSSSHPEEEVNAVSSFLAVCPFTQIFEFAGQFAPDSDDETHFFNTISRIYLSPNGFQYLSSTEQYFVKALESSSRKKISEGVASLLLKMSTLNVGCAEGLLSSAELRNALLSSVARSEISIFQYTSKTLISSLKQLLSVNESENEFANAVKLICGKAMLEETHMKAKGHSNDTIVLMRYIELLVHISILDDSFFKIAMDGSMLDIIVDVIKQNDPLLQMNILDLTEKLCDSPLHVKYLFKSGITEWLLYLITGDNAPNWVNNPSPTPDILLAPQSLRIISMMFASTYSSTSDATHNEINLNDGEVIPPELILRFLTAACKFGDDPSNEASNLAAFDAVSNFAGSSPANLGMVLDNKQLAASWLTLPSRTSTKAFVLHSIAQVISPRILDKEHSSSRPPVVDANPSFSGTPHAQTRITLPPPVPGQASEQLPNDHEESMNKRLFLDFGKYNGYNSGPTTMAFLVESQRKPISEIRDAVFDVLRACAAKEQWGINFMSACGGFFDFLGNRHTEFNKEGMEWKFSVIEALVNNENLLIVIKNNEIIEKLRLMLTEGPFYVPYTPDGPVTMNS